MNSGVSIAATFGAGLLAFLSPCILPVIPSYLCFIGGISLQGGAFKKVNKKADMDQDGAYSGHIIRGTISFVLGFSTVFILLSIILSKVIFFLNGVTQIINIAAGIIVILMGLHVLFNIFPFLNYEKKIDIKKKPKNAAACFLVGLAFGSGWTPCISPILTGILFLASQDGETGKAIFLLAVFSLGLGLPFILAAVFFQFFLRHLSKIKFVLPWIQKVSGVLLIGLGILIMSGQMRVLNSILSGF